MRILIQPDYETLSKWNAHYVAKKIKDFKPTHDQPFVIGLPTGSSPIGTYRELVKLNKEGKISFKNVVTFNMDEYVGLPKTHPESYWYFMHHHLFNHIDITPENINILNGNVEELQLECQRYELKIKNYGNIHLFLGGI